MKTAISGEGVGERPAAAWKAEVPGLLELLGLSLVFRLERPVLSLRGFCAQLRLPDQGLLRLLPELEIPEADECGETQYPYRM